MEKAVELVLKKFYPDEKIVENYEQILEDPKSKGFDISLKYPQNIKKMLEHGRYVLSQKEYSKRANELTRLIVMHLANSYPTWDY